MRYLILVGALAVLVLSPLPAAAQQTPAAPSTIGGVDTLKVLAVTVGAILGVAAAEAIIGGEVATLAGGVVGGLVGVWWYENSSAVVAHIRAAGRAPTLAGAERLALAR